MTSDVLPVAMFSKTHSAMFSFAQQSKLWLKAIKSHRVFFTIFPNSPGGENVNFSLGGERVFLMCRFSPCGEHVNFSPFGENVNFSLGGERIFLMLGFSPSGDKVSLSLIGEYSFTYW